MTLAIPQPVRKPSAPPPAPPGMHDLMRDALAGYLEIVPLTVEQYHTMIDAGWEDSTIELLNGLLVRKIRGTRENPMGHGHRHAFSIKAVEKLEAQVQRHGGHIRTQMPIVAWNDSEPEPDGAIVRGTFEDYALATPTCGEVSCVIEVADASLRTDRRRKLQTYARSDIPQYVLINLVDDDVELFEDPDPTTGVYRRSVIALARETIQLLLPDGGKLDVVVRDLIPPRSPSP